MMTPETALGLENNNCTTGETYGGVYDKTDGLSGQSQTQCYTGPADTACIQITENGGSGATLRKPETQVGAGGAGADGLQVVEQGVDVDDQSMEGFPLKWAHIRKAMKHVHQKAWSNIALAALRNLLTWMCIVSLVVIISNASSMHTWSHQEIAAAVCIFGIGLFGAGFHVFRSYMDLSFKYPTLVSRLLRDALSREEFVRLMQNRQMSPPEISVEVRLKSGAMTSEGPDHWTRTRSRKTGREISYRGWADQSAPTSCFQWPEGRTAWVVVGKDFRSLDRATKDKVEAEVAEFRKETGYDANRYFMDLEFVLQWKESDSSDDVEAFLVFEDIRPGFYFLELYQATVLIAMDAIYRAIFHLATKNLNDYYIVKFIEK